MKVDRWLLVLALLLLVATWVRWRRALPYVDDSPLQVSAVARSVSGIPADTLDAYAEAITANDPFRLSNRPADMRFDARVENVVAAGTAAPVVGVRPQLVVRGIVGGPPWQAIIDGLPGQSAGTVVTPGATFEKLVVRTVSRDSVVVQGPDTTWRLTLNRPKP